MLQPGSQARRPSGISVLTSMLSSRPLALALGRGLALALALALGERLDLFLLFLLLLSPPSSSSSAPSSSAPSSPAACSRGRLELRLAGLPREALAALAARGLVRPLPLPLWLSGVEPCVLKPRVGSRRGSRDACSHTWHKGQAGWSGRSAATRGTKARQGPGAERAV